MNNPSGQVTILICFVVISIATVGYFTGLQSPMNPGIQLSDYQAGGQSGQTQPVVLGDAIPSTHYAELSQAIRNKQIAQTTLLTGLSTTLDPLAEIQISPSDKSFALALREQNRAFNGAPPTVPHPVDQLSSDACMACHGQGYQSETFRISKMSHQYLANCTQCHIENSPEHMTPILFRDNEFVGMPAPTGGPRAFEGAPPMIPHSTWMRVDCLSCHGITGSHGIKTTHPWRSSCQQCHAPSSKLEQVRLDSTPLFLAPPQIVR